MPYLIALILLTITAFLLVKFVLSKAAIKRETALEDLKSECDRIYSEIRELREKNFALERSVTETIALYDITKDISRELNQDKVFSIFKERINNYMQVTDCRILDKKEEAGIYKDYLQFPLAIDKDTKGYLIACGIKEKDKGRFQILAQQLLSILKRSLLYKKIQELAIMDGLTSLFTRRHFLERLNEEIKRSRKFKHCFSFLMIDIDRFKGFNDKYGHLVGDAILREISKTIKGTVRQIDFAGRYGGEELSIVLPETDKEQALLAAERIRHGIEAKKIKVYDEELKVTVSVGISTFPDDANDSRFLIETADSALYLAKDSGRNKVLAYHK
ncbi:MAG: GGDEF domain-containing protein [Candidatus Omnitrophica bacterium]|nr:GGDEF domain-containing protein [Candidatus Omnitrophota bacterium]